MLINDKECLTFDQITIKYNCSIFKLQKYLISGSLKAMETGNGKLYVEEEKIRKLFKLRETNKGYDNEKK